MTNHVDDDAEGHYIAAVPLDLDRFVDLKQNLDRWEARRRVDAILLKKIGSRHQALSSEVIQQHILSFADNRFGVLSNLCSPTSLAEAPALESESGLVGRPHLYQISFSRDINELQVDFMLAPSLSCVIDKMLARWQDFVDLFKFAHLHCAEARTNSYGKVEPFFASIKQKYLECKNQKSDSKESARAKGKHQEENDQIGVMYEDPMMGQVYGQLSSSQREELCGLVQLFYIKAGRMQSITIEPINVLANTFLHSDLQPLT